MNIAPVLVISALVAGATPSPAPKAPELAIESYRLDNGLKVVLHRDTTVPRVTVCVAYHVGSKNEAAGRTGFAHFFEHMMFRGTKNVPNYDVPLQETGAQSNAFTNEDLTVYFETVPSNFLERAVYLEAERLAYLPTALAKEKFDTEREVVKNERRQSYENVPYGLAEESILANVFPKGHPYSWSVIGSMKDLDNATLDDLRQFFAEFYHPANATLCLAGDFDPAQARDLITRYFGPIPAGPKVAPVEVAVGQAKPAMAIQVDQVQLPRVYWSWPTVADEHADAPALDLLATVLAGGEASRLHRALVLDKRLATEADADSDTKEIAGLFTIQATAAEGKSLEEIQETLAAELARLRREPPTADELERALALHEKQTYQGLTSPLSRAITLAVGFAQKDDPTSYRRDFLRYFAVKPDDLRRVAGTYLVPEKFVLKVEPATPGHEETPATTAGPLPRGPKERAIAPRGVAAGPEWAKLPGPDAPKPFSPPKVVKTRLANGLEVWVARWNVLPVVSLRMFVPSGTADDPSGKSGLATLTASMLDKGTRSKSATEFAESLERLGATLRVGASPDQIGWSLSTIARTLDPTLDLLAESLTEPRFDPADFSRERELQLADLLQGPDSATWIARRAFRTLLYGEGHPYANPDGGRVETVKALGLDDVKAFHAAHVSPSHAVLIVVGDVDPEKLNATLERTLGRWKGEDRQPATRPPFRMKHEPGVVYLANKPGAVQSVLGVGRPWVARNDPSYFATLLGNRMLGADFLSRLNQNLREKNGFTYGAGSAFVFRRDQSMWAVNTSVRADATAPALKEVLGELESLAGGKPFTEEEIETARAAEMRSYPESFDSPSSIAGVLEELAEFHLPPDYLSTVLDGLQDAKKQAIDRAMADVVNDETRLVLVVGDRKTVEPKLRELGFTEIRHVDADGRPKAD